MSSTTDRRTTAVRFERTGGPEVLQLAEVDVPAPGPGEVLVEVAVAGVNFMDVYQRNGTYPLTLPSQLGGEGSGRVVALGSGVEGLTEGDRVAWASVPGSYAGLVVAPAGHLSRVPDEVDDEHAAALPLQGMTAHYLAVDSHPIAAGETVLVHAGAGGTGLLLTQIARIRGARVITTVSTPEKAERSRAAGADEVLVGYDGIVAAVRELTDGEGVAAVYDGVGRATFEASLDSLAVRGTLVLFGGSSGQVPPFDPQRLNQAGSLFLTRPNLAHHTRTPAERAGRMADLFGWLADGSLTLSIGGRYPLADVARAHEDLEARRTTGKLLLLPAG
jgi:NADPH2:quinone reductase